jgi:hypothetical protein
VTVTNSGQGSLNVASVGTTDDFGQTNTCTTGLSHNQSCTVSVTFRPMTVAAHSGQLSITHNAAGSPRTYTLSGTGTAPVTVTTPSAFSATVIGVTSSSKTVTVTNNLNTTLPITGVSLTGDFIISPASDDTCSGHTLGASGQNNSDCTIKVKFLPTATGARTGTLTVTDTSVTSPHVVNLSGTGSPQISFSPSTGLSFSNQKVGTQSATKTLTFTNDFTATIAVSSVGISGDYLISTDNCSGHTLTTSGGSSSCTVLVKFAPTALGTRTGSLSLNSAAAESPDVAPLTGVGIP